MIVSMDTPLAHLDRAVEAWRARGDAIRGLSEPGLGGPETGLEGDVEAHLADEAHNEWEGAEDVGFTE